MSDFATGAEVVDRSWLTLDRAAAIGRRYGVLILIVLLMTVLTMLWAEWVA